MARRPQVLIVAHQAPCRLLRAYLLGLPLAPSLHDDGSSAGCAALADGATALLVEPLVDDRCRPIAASFNLKRPKRFAVFVAERRVADVEALAVDVAVLHEWEQIHGGYDTVKEAGLVGVGVYGEHLCAGLWCCASGYAPTTQCS